MNKPDQDGDRHRHDVGIEEGRGDVQSFDRAQDRNRRRDHSIGVEQRGPEQSKKQKPFRATGDVSRPKWQAREFRLHRDYRPGE